jgi:hypothetical protein
MQLLMLPVALSSFKQAAAAMEAQHTLERLWMLFLFVTHKHAAVQVTKCQAAHRVLQHFCIC